MKHLLSAFRFLTILPFPSRYNYHITPEAMFYFPLIGLSIGGILVLVLFLTRPFSFLLVHIIILSVWVLLTGAFHLDGFVDTVDGLSGGKSQREILEIMEDSHNGAKGITALVLLIICKLALLMEIDKDYKIPSLLITPTIGRWVLVISAYWGGCAKRKGIGAMFIGKVGRGALFISSLTTVILSIILFRLKSLYILVLVLFFVFVMLMFFKRRIGGITGDILGMVCEVIEVVVLFTIVAM